MVASVWTKDQPGSQLGTSKFEDLTDASTEKFNLMSEKFINAPKSQWTKDV